MTERPIAVVAGLELNGLGVARSLHGGGVTVVALCDNPDNVLRHTRAARRIVDAPLGGADFIAALQKLRANLDHDPVLFLTKEESVLAVAARRDALGGYRFAMPAEENVRALMNKDRFVATAAEAGLPQVDGITVRAASDVAQIARLPAPLIVKPAERSAAYNARFAKAYVVEDAQAAGTLAFDMLAVTPEIIVQQFVPGGDDAIYFCLQYRNHEGRLCASFTGRKTASWPPRVGGTAECVAAPEAHAELDRLTSAFFERAGFIGMGGVEYKRDPRDGRFYLIEPTVCRTDYQQEVATLNGVNLPLVAWCSEAGLPLPEARPHARLGWRDSGAVASGAQVMRHGRNADGSRWRSVDALFRAGDPLPWMAQMARRIRRRLG